MNWKKKFLLGKTEWTHWWEFSAYHKTFGQKALKIFISSLCIYVYSISEWTQKIKVIILSLVFTIIFPFIRTLFIPLSFFSGLFSTLILDEKYMDCLIKNQKNSQERPLWVIVIRIGIKLKINISYILAAAKTLRSFKKYVHSRLLIFEWKIIEWKEKIIIFL